MGLNLGSLVNPLGPLIQTSTMFGKDLTPAQEQVMGDLGKGKFQRSDLPALRGVMNKGVDNATFGGIPVSQEVGRWFDRNMPNTFGNQNGSEEANMRAAESGFGSDSQVQAAQQAASQRRAVAGPTPETMTPPPESNMPPPEGISMTPAELELLKSQGYI